MPESYLNLQRHTTNSTSRIVFGIYLLLWIVLGVYAICIGESSTILNDFFDGFKDNKLSSFIRIVISVVIGIVLIGLLKIFTKFFVYAGIFFTYLMLIEFIILIPISLFRITTWSSVPLYILLTLLYFTVVRNIGSVGTINIIKLIKTSCSVTFQYPLSFLISALTTIAVIIQLVFVTIATISLFSITNSDGVVPVSSIVLVLILIIGSLWPLVFIYDLSYIALSSAFITCHLDEGKRITNSEVNCNVISVIRYHYGTNCYGSSMIMATYETLKTVILNKYDTRYPLNNHESSFTLYMCKFYLMLSNRVFTNGSYTMTALKGNDFSGSVKEVYDVVIRQPVKFLVLSIISNMSVGVVMVIVSTFSTLTYVTDLEYMNNDYNFIPFIFTITLSAFITLTVVTPILVAILTILICNLNDEKFNLPTNNFVYGRNNY